MWRPLVLYKSWFIQSLDNLSFCNDSFTLSNFPTGMPSLTPTCLLYPLNHHKDSILFLLQWFSHSDSLSHWHGHFSAHLFTIAYDSIQSPPIFTFVWILILCVFPNCHGLFNAHLFAITSESFQSLVKIIPTPTIYIYMCMELDKSLSNWRLCNGSEFITNRGDGTVMGTGRR